jgi:hypothetical protein
MWPALKGHKKPLGFLISSITWVYTQPPYQYTSTTLLHDQYLTPTWSNNVQNISASVIITAGIGFSLKTSPSSQFQASTIVLIYSRKYSTVLHSNRLQPTSTYSQYVDPLHTLNGFFLKLSYLCNGFSLQHQGFFRPCYVLYIRFFHLFNNTRFIHYHLSHSHVGGDCCNIQHVH